MKKSLLTAATAAAVALMFAGCEKTPEEKLIKGIETGDAVLVQQAIEENVKLPAAKDSQGRSPHDLLEIKKNALIAGILNDYFKQNTIALGRAKTAEEAKAIIEKGAGMGLISSGRNPSALHVAVRENNTEMVKYLITSCGFDVNLHNDKVMPPLAWAVRADNVEMAKLLISNGASLKLLDKHAYSLGPRFWIKGNPLIFDENDKKVAEQLKQIIRRTETCVKIGWLSPQKIFESSCIDDKSFILKLLNFGVSTKNKRGIKLLKFAVSNNDIELAKLIISKGVDINVKDVEEMLSIAVKNNNIEMVSLLFVSRLPAKDGIVLKDVGVVLLKGDEKSINSDIQKGCTLWMMGVRDAARAESFCDHIKIKKIKEGAFFFRANLPNFILVDTNSSAFSHALSAAREERRKEWQRQDEEEFNRRKLSNYERLREQINRNNVRSLNEPNAFDYNRARTIYKEAKKKAGSSSMITGMVTYNNGTALLEKFNVREYKKD